MARILKIDRKFYGDDGMASFYKGDDISFYGKIIDRVNGYDTGVDLSPFSATGYFPSVTGNVQLPCTAVTGDCGTLTVLIPKAQSVQLATNGSGEDFYVILQDGAGNLQTVSTVDAAIAILNRGGVCS